MCLHAMKLYALSLALTNDKFYIYLDFWRVFRQLFFPRCYYSREMNYNYIFAWHRRMVNVNVNVPSAHLKLIKLCENNNGDQLQSRETLAESNWIQRASFFARASESSTRSSLSFSGNKSGNWSKMLIVMALHELVSILRAVKATSELGVWTKTNGEERQECRAIFVLVNFHLFIENWIYSVV